MTAPILTLLPVDEKFAIKFVKLVPRGKSTRTVFAVSLIVPISGNPTNEKAVKALAAAGATVTVTI